MKHHLLQYDPETRLWSRPDILPGHVFGQPEHALAFGHTDTRTPNPESGIWFQVRVDEEIGTALVEQHGGETSLVAFNPAYLRTLISNHLESQVTPLHVSDIRSFLTP